MPGPSVEKPLMMREHRFATRKSVRGAKRLARRPVPSLSVVRILSAFLVTAIIGGCSHASIHRQDAASAANLATVLLGSGTPARIELGHANDTTAVPALYDSTTALRGTLWFRKVVLALQRSSAERSNCGPPPPAWRIRFFASDGSLMSSLIVDDPVSCAEIVSTLPGDTGAYLITGPLSSVLQRILPALQ